MQPKPFPESQNHGDWRESKSRRPFFRSLLDNNPSQRCVEFRFSVKRNSNSNAQADYDYRLALAILRFQTSGI
jgi:hypothetical protein